MISFKEFISRSFDFLKELISYFIVSVCLILAILILDSEYTTYKENKDRLESNKTEFINTIIELDNTIPEDKLNTMYEDLLKLDGFPDIIKNKEDILEANIVGDSAINIVVKYRPYQDLMMFKTKYSIVVYYNDNFNIIKQEERNEEEWRR